MKLYRVIMGIESTFVVAETEADAKRLVVRSAGYEDVGDDYGLIHRIVEYPLDRAYILPASWMSEPAGPAGTDADQAA